MQYLEEKYPQHPLLPQDLEKRGINYQVIMHLFLFCFVLFLNSLTSMNGLIVDS